MSSENRLLGLSIHYKNKEVVFDDFNNIVVLFFNGNFSRDIKPLIKKFTDSALGVTNKVERIKNELLSKEFIDKVFNDLSKNSFNVIDFIEFGQNRKKDWYYMDYQEYKEIAPKPKHKKKFLKPRKQIRKR